MQVEFSKELDWAASIQKRFGEELAMLVAQDALESVDEEHPHYKRVLAAASKLGVEDFAKILEEHSSKLHKVTEFDEPHVRAALEPMLHQIKALAKDAGYSLGDVIISSLPSGSVSALCASNSWDARKYIFVDSDLLVFCNSISKVISSCFKLESSPQGSFIDLTSKQAIKEAKSNREIARRIIDLVRSTVLHGYARASEPWIPEPDRLPAAILLCRQMEMFVLAHELAHAICGHLEPEAQARVGAPYLPDVDVLVMSHEQEFEADAAGLILSVAVADREEAYFTTAVSGAYILLKSVQLLDECCSIFGETVSELLSTHPSPSQRARHLLETALHIAPRDEYRAGVKAQARRMDQVFYWLSRHVTESLQKAKAAGLVPKRKKLQRVLELNKPAILGFRSQEHPTQSEAVESLRRLI